MARRRSYGSVHPTLDLHGETADEARLRAERWLRARAAEGVRTVVIVTGRGLHSPGPPVLPGEIRHLLDTLRGTLVDDWMPESGGGALRVELRLQRRAAPRAAGQPKLLDNPELRRRAEESLAELGIAPTPVLLAAEMQRLRDQR